MNLLKTVKCYKISSPFQCLRQRTTGDRSTNSSLREKMGSSHLATSGSRNNLLLLNCQLFLVRITTKSGHGPFIAVYSLKVLLYPLFRMTLRWEGLGRGGGGAGKEDRKAKGRREGGGWVQLWWKHWKQVWNSLLHTANTGDRKNLF